MFEKKYDSEIEALEKRLEALEKRENSDARYRKLEDSIDFQNQRINQLKDMISDSVDAQNARISSVIRIRKKDLKDEERSKPYALQPVSANEVMRLLALTDEERKAVLASPEELKKLGIDLDTLSP